MTNTLTTADGTHRCQGYGCAAVHVAAADARAAIGQHTAAGWSVVATTRDAVTLGRLGARMVITTAPRVVEPWE
jgi:hypothetical protein